ncbi:MAG: hypothetical protein IFK94_10850 [Acidobacteria bacterium]|uniref:Uncharacterized protein n=1 Tax=Candidatus Polarisedimenticola svalbardensis TaxID=2886004 RepID=A0A8J7C2W5_9BACT|nr:hypothetical protein [Candidatus Polarisedimenticola svalbardensis]
MSIWKRTAGLVLLAVAVLVAGCGTQVEEVEAGYVSRAFAVSVANNLKQANGLMLVGDDGETDPDRILSGTLPRDGLAVPVPGLIRRT